MLKDGRWELSFFPVVSVSFAFSTLICFIRLYIAPITAQLGMSIHREGKRTFGAVRLITASDTHISCP